MKKGLLFLKSKMMGAGHTEFPAPLHLSKHLYNTLQWFLIAIFFIITVISSFDYGEPLNNIMPLISVVSLLGAAVLHGITRYNVLDILTFFVITWIISLFFEALSIQVGFPFGHYYYDKLAGPRLFEVPLIIMFAYFSMAYISWILSNILLRQYGKPLHGKKVFFIPLIATFIMVMWDLCMDPHSSTIGKLWVWKEGGSYYGVPLQNYFGWFLVVFLIFQSFSLYIAKSKAKAFEKDFWLQAIALYAIQALFQILSPFTVSTNPDIYGPMALITIFTMGFVSLLSLITLEGAQN